MKFKVGDVCIVKDCNCRPELRRIVSAVGRECTVIAVDPADPDGFYYETDIPSANPNLYWMNCWACDNCLELKRPPAPREELGEWELCPWRPEPVTISGDLYEKVTA